jgi:hypothetical protein
VGIILARCDTQVIKTATFGSERRFNVKTAIRKATEVIAVTADLYRELTLSALRLLPGRQ